MHTRSQALVRVLLNRYHQKGKEALLRHLPKEEADAIAATEISSDNPKLLLTQDIDCLSRIHYSWLQPAIQHMPKSLRRAIFSVLTPEQTNKLKQWFPEASRGHQELTPWVRTYLLNTLYQHIEHLETLPVAYLPVTPLTPLATWNKKQLVELITYLGIHDLAYEVRQIISNERLQKLIPCLDSKQKQYLRMCMHQKERIVPPPIGLDRWDGEAKSLKIMIHRRGILRLGKALCGQHEDLFWHIVHTLDTGRGNALVQHYSHVVIPGITPVLVQQVSSLMTFLQTKGET